MKTPRWVGWSAVVAGLVLILVGWFALSFLTEPSAVGRVRGLLVFIGAGSIVVGAAGGLAGVWMLFVRRT